MSAADGVRMALRTVFGSTGAAVDTLLATDARIRAGLPLSRRIGFVSMAGGSGTTTVVASVAATLAARRSGSVLAVDADGGRAGLGRQLIAVQPRRSGDPSGNGSAGPSAAAVDPAERRRTARTAEEARSGLAQAGPRLQLLDLNDPAGSGAATPLPRSVADWTDQLGPIARFFDLVLTDWGVRPAAEDLEQVATAGHVLVVVSRADQPAATAAAATVAALQTLPQPPRLVLALADVDRTATPRRIARTLGGSLGIPVYRLPYDPVVGSDWLYATGRRSVRSRRAIARLAAGLVTEAAASRAPGRLPTASPTSGVPTRGVPTDGAPTGGVPADRVVRAV